MALILQIVSNSDRNGDRIQIKPFSVSMINTKEKALSVLGSKGVSLLEGP